MVLFFCIGLLCPSDADIFTLCTAGGVYIFYTIYSCHPSLDAINTPEDLSTMGRSSTVI